MTSGIRYPSPKVDDHRVDRRTRDTPSCRSQRVLRLLKLFLPNASLDKIDVSDRPTSGGASEILQASIDESNHKSRLRRSSRHRERKSICDMLVVMAAVRIEERLGVKRQSATYSTN